MSYLRRLRVNKAMLLIADSSKPICDIAQEVGFWDSGYFARIFKKETGSTPSKFRQRL